jgi:transposase-like protein
MRAMPDEQSAIDHFTSIRWKDGAFCPYCKHDKIFHFADKRTHKCAACRRRFSIKVGTIFQDSKLQLRVWLMAIWYVTSHKKGISSVQLAKDLDITQKSAWFVLRRLNKAAETKSFNAPLTGFVESDQFFVGGRETNKHLSKRAKKAHGGKGKEMVVGVIQRGGELRTAHASIRKGSVNAFVESNVAEGSNLMTDATPIHRGLKGYYHHYSVDHSKGEYVRSEFIHTNSIESVWALFRRQIIGTHHWVSPKHLNRYLSEMTWRFNRRNIGEGSRANALIAGSDGRLTYKALIAE